MAKPIVSGLQLQTAPPLALPASVRTFISNQGESSQYNYSQLVNSFSDFVNAGTANQLPTAGLQGRHFFATDSNTLWLDNGNTQVPIPVGYYAPGQLQGIAQLSTFSFNGASSVTFPLLSTTTNTTIEAIVNPASGGHGAIVKLGALHDGWGVGLGDGGSWDGVGQQVEGLFESTRWIPVTGHPTLTVGTPAVVGMVIDGSSVPTFYVNGTAFTQLSPGTGILTPSTSAYIGGDQGDLARFFTGSITRVAVYNAALSGARMAAHAAQLNNLAAYDAAVLADTPWTYLKLVDAPGSGIAADASGNGRNGAYQGLVYNSTINVTPPLTSYAQLLNIPITMQFTATNAGPIAININNIGQVNIVKNLNQPLIAGDIPSGGGMVSLVYDGTNFQAIAGLTGFTSTTAYGVTTGTNSYSVTVTYQTLLSAAEGYPFIVQFANANTGACTLNINGLGAIPLRKNKNQELITGDILVNNSTHVIYDGTQFQLQAPNGPAHRDLTGTANGTGLYTVGVGWNPTSLSQITGIPIQVRFANSNASANPQLQVNSLPAATIVAANGSTLQAGNIQANASSHVIFNGINFFLQSGYTIPTSGGGTGTTSPAIVAGTGIAVSGPWPNQTIASIVGQNLARPGFVQFQGGLIVQWGTVASGTVTAGGFVQVPVTLPLTWPNGYFVSMATPSVTALICGGSFVSNSSINVTAWNLSGGNLSDTLVWIAIGH